MYLGGLLSASGDQGSEITRRLGEAGAAFEKLTAIWKHANLTRSRKLRIFEACVQTKLLYSLDSVCLRQAERSRVDAFQAKCLRRVFGIPHSYLSRVSNAEVRAVAGRPPLSQIILASQLQLYGRVATLREDSLVRKVAIEPGGIRPQCFAHARRQGRPRLQWSTNVYAHAFNAAGGAAELSRLLTPAARAEWQRAVRSYCFN